MLAPRNSASSTGLPSRAGKARPGRGRRPWGSAAQLAPVRSRHRSPDSGRARGFAAGQGRARSARRPPAARRCGPGRRRGRPTGCRWRRTLARPRNPGQGRSGRQAHRPLASAVPVETTSSFGAPSGGFAAKDFRSSSMRRRSRSPGSRREPGSARPGSRRRSWVGPRGPAT